MTGLIHVLLVDDNPHDRELVRDALEKVSGGFRITEVASRAEFEASLEKFDYDLVLSDFNILGFEGIEVVDIVRAKHPNTPVVIVTGTGSEKIAVEAMKRGAADYVIKSIDHINRLPVTIKSVIEHQHLQEERKRTEEELRESEEMFRNLSEQSPTMVFINRKGKVVYVNRRCEEIMGYTREELLSSDFDFLVLIAPEYVHMVKVNLARHMEGEEVPPWEYALIAKDGRRIKALISTKLIDYKGEKAILGVITDITKQKRIEETLKESEKRFREIVELSADAIISCIDCKISLWNRAAEAMFGYTEEEVLGKGVEIIIPEQYRDAHRAAFEKAVETGEFRLAGEVVELEGLRKDGADFPVSLSLATSLHDKELYSTAIIRDITERRRAEETLRRMIEGTVAVAGEKFFDKLVESLSLALEVNIVFCAEYLDGRARTLAIRIGGECAENFEWPVAGTPCEEVLEGKIMFFAEEVQAQFPEDKWLAEVGAESYLGVPVTDSEGKVIGHMGVLDDKLMPGQSHIEPVIQIFAARAGAEIERMRINERLKQKLDEVERINKLMVGRELKMEEMRKEIGRLNKEIQDLRFKIQK